MRIFTNFKMHCQIVLTGNGNCTSFDTCDCYAGWGGLSCSVADCSSLSSCTSNGDCVRPNTCACYSGFVGQACNMTLNCVEFNNCSDNGVCVLNDSEELSCRYFNNVLKVCHTLLFSISNIFPFFVPLVT